MKHKVTINHEPETMEKIRERMKENLAKEMQKYERDIKCGGVRGCGYIALHSRYYS